MPRLAFITTCRGRLAHLRQSLPTFVAQADAEVVVVDYDCPERSGEWVEQAKPRTIETWGTSISARADFEPGARHCVFPGEVLRPLSHDDAQRVESYDLEDR